MAVHGRRHKGSALLLVIGLIFAVAIFGAPKRYSLGTSVALTAGQLLLIGGAAGSLVLAAWQSRDKTRRRIALAGCLLIVPWALLTLMPGYGPPFASSLSMNHTRFLILFLSTAVLGMAMLLLKEPLAEGPDGDRILAPLGQASGLLATFIQLVWAAILVGWTMSEAHKPAAYLPLYGTPLGNASDVLLFFAGLMTYGATAFYALSFVRQGWLGPIKGWVMAGISVIAVIGLVMRGLQYPDLPENWYSIPGMIVGIPAVPWLMPYILGVAALFYAANGEASQGR
jgi:hypothetical protein